MCRFAAAVLSVSATILTVATAVLTVATSVLTVATTILTVVATILTVVATILTIRAAAIVVAESADLLVLQPDGLLSTRPHLHAVPRHALDELVLVVRIRVVLLSAANAGIHVCADVTIVVIVDIRFLAEFSTFAFPSASPVAGQSSFEFWHRIM